MQPRPPDLPEGAVWNPQTQWQELNREEQDTFLAMKRGEMLCNIEVEQALLGAVLLNNEAFYKIRCNLQPQHFYHDLHQKIYDDILFSIAEGSLATPVTLAHKYRLMDGDHAEYLGKLAVSAISIINVAEYAQIVYDLFNRREMHRFMIEALNELVSDKQLFKDAGVYRMETIDKLMDMGEDISAKRIRTLEEVTDDILKDMARETKPDSTGLHCLDTILAGGLYPRKVYDINAKAKMGKTVMMTTIFSNIIDHLTESNKKLPQGERPETVLYICAEMGAPEIQQRLMADKMNASSTHFYTKSGEMELYQDAADYRRSIEGSPGRFYDARGLKGKELKHILLSAVKVHRIKGFFLDYFGLVRPDKPTSNPVAFYEDLADWICAFCKEHNVWCVTAQQINREGFIRGGDALLMYADYVGQLFRDEASGTAYVQTKAIRYTVRQDAGTKKDPALLMVKAPKFVDLQVVDEDASGGVHDYVPEARNF